MTTQVISRVHSVHLMNVEQRQEAADLRLQSREFSCESACRFNNLLVSSLILVNKFTECCYS